ncbi:MAG: hypothetical protein RL326_688 [Pseudomonadota bacterium]
MRIFSSFCLLVFHTAIIFSGTGITVASAESRFDPRLEHPTFKPTRSPRNADPCAPTVICHEGAIGRGYCDSVGNAAWGSDKYFMYSWQSRSRDLKPILGLAAWASALYRNRNCPAMKTPEKGLPIALVSPEFYPMPVASASPVSFFVGEEVNDAALLREFLDSWSEYLKTCPDGKCSQAGACGCIACETCGSCVGEGLNAPGECCAGTVRCNDGYCRKSCPSCVVELSNAPGQCCTGTRRCDDGYCRRACPASCVPDSSSALGQCCTGTSRCKDGYCRRACSSCIPDGSSCVKGQAGCCSGPCTVGTCGSLSPIW